MDSVGKDVFSDEMDFFCEWKNGSNAYRIRLSPALRSRSEKKVWNFLKKGVDKKIYSGKMVKLSREHSMNLENDTETETQERQQVPESIQD